MIKEKVRKFLKEHTSFENGYFMLLSERMPEVSIGISSFGYFVSVFREPYTKIETFKEGEEGAMMDWIIDTLVENPHKHNLVNLITLCAKEFRVKLVRLPYRPKDQLFELIRKDKNLQKALNIKVIKPPYDTRGVKPDKFWISEDI